MLAPQELLALEGVEALVEGRGLHAGQTRERVRPDDLAEHRRELEELLLRGRQRVDPRGDHPLQRLGRADRRVEPAGEQTRVLLGEERVPSRPLQERRLLLGGQDGRAEERGEKPGRLRIRERGEGDGGGVPLSSTPARATLEQLGPGRAHDEQGDAGHAVREGVDEVEQRVVGPVEVLEDEHGRPLLGQRLDESTPGPERLVEARLSRRSGQLDAGQREEVALEPRGLRLVGGDVAHGARNLRRGLVRPVRLEDAGLRLDDLRQGPEGRALAVGQRAPLAPDDQVRVVVDGLEELPHEP